jgi:peptidoglycan/LPS O-acetylase OafA/YrhL
MGPELNRARNNFDLLRLMAASLVVVAHASVVLHNRILTPDPVRMLTGVEMGKAGVLIFFIISGYLVSGSWEERKSAAMFLRARILRIFPAVIVIVLVSVFVLGWSVTSLDTAAYFGSGSTFLYLQDMSLYRMYYYLPGVFENNPAGPSVNASLWTLPYEFTCYLVLLVAGMAGAYRNKLIIPCLFSVSAAAYHIYGDVINSWVIPVLGIDFKTYGILLLYFLSGMSFFVLRNNIPLSKAGLLLSFLGAVLMKLEWLPSLAGLFIWPYLVLYLASTPLLQPLKAARYGDFSYGLYLYAFPVQQLIVHLFPEPGPYWLFVLYSFAGTMPFAVLSWHLVEKPALRLKGK